MEAGPDLRYTRTSDEVTIVYQVLGAGPTVVWMPSLGDLRAQWRVPMLRAAYTQLARSVRLVLYDGRGMGNSDRRLDPLGLGLEAHRRDLEAVIGAVGAPAVALLGYYHSVATALAHAADRPAAVTRMVLFGGAPRMRDAMSPTQNQALLWPVDQDWDLFADTAATAWLGWSAGESGQLVADAFRSAATPTVAKAWFAAAAAIDVTDLLPKIGTPTLVLYRQGARQIPVEVSRRLAAGLPDARLVELPGSSPTLFLENAAGDLDLVTRFLTGGDVASAAVPADGVTARELDVLRLLAQGGDSNAQIARALGIAVHTVERHTANLYRKIGARGRAEATAYAVRRGIA